jgi:hypothetical protein
MGLVRSKALVMLLLLQLARPISGLRFTVGAHLCAKRAAQPSASWRSPRGCHSSGGCSERPSTPEPTTEPGPESLSLAPSLRPSRSLSPSLSPSLSLSLPPSLSQPRPSRCC